MTQSFPANLLIYSRLIATFAIHFIQLEMLFIAAPLQGFTQAPWRAIHSGMFPGAVDEYFTPFMRLESGEPRARDLRDITAGTNLTVQIMARDAGEFAVLTEAAVAAGATRIDLNAGCPYPMVTRKGRGAALIENPAALSAIGEEMRKWPEVGFSMKMRLGTEKPEAWRGSADAIAAMPLRLLTVHSRVARQLYSGELFMEEFNELLKTSAHPVIFNGEMATPGDIRRITDSFPGIAGVMCGRGLLRRPTLASEWKAGADASEADRRHASVEILTRLFMHYSSTLCGPSHILSKIKPFTGYLDADLFDKKALKALRTAPPPDRFHSLFASL